MQREIKDEANVGGRPNGIVNSQAQRPPSNAVGGKAALLNVIRDQFSISTWLCLGGLIQASLFWLIGRHAVIATGALLLYKFVYVRLIVSGLLRDTSRDGITMGKFTAQIPDSTGLCGKPSNTDVVVFLLGTRCNHPLGLFAPGYKDLGGYFQQMTESLDAYAEDFDYLGMTSWINASDRTTSSELLYICYFKTVEGLHRFAHSSHHRKGWDWWTRHTKQYPHLSIFHETYHVPKNHWENIFINYHTSGIASTSHRIISEETGQTSWTRSVVDASRGVLRTSNGRLGRSDGDEHDQYADGNKQV